MLVDVTLEGTLSRAEALGKLVEAEGIIATLTTRVAELEATSRRLCTIADRCPCCSNRSLFVGTGGWLTCSQIGCKEPGLTRAIDALRAKLQPRPKEKLQRGWRPNCKGTGGGPEHSTRCMFCDGTGVIEKPQPGDEEAPHPPTCPNCKGVGEHEPYCPFEDFPSAPQPHPQVGRE